MEQLSLIPGDTCEHCCKDEPIDMINRIINPSGFQRQYTFIVKMSNTEGAVEHYELPRYWQQRLMQ